MSKISDLSSKIAAVNDSIERLEKCIQPRLISDWMLNSYDLISVAFGNLSPIDRSATVEFIKSRLEVHLESLTKEFKELI